MYMRECSVQHVRSTTCIQNKWMFHFCATFCAVLCALTGNYQVVIQVTAGIVKCHSFLSDFNTLRTGDADLRFYVTTVQDG